MFGIFVIFFMLLKKHDLTVYLCLLCPVQYAPVPPSAQQTTVPDPPDRRGPARTLHLLSRGQLVPSGGGLPPGAQVLNIELFKFDVQ